MKAITASIFAAGAALLAYELFVRYIEGNIHADFMPAASLLLLALTIHVIWGRADQAG